MSKAWLDSLSEDWISQPRSEGSPDATLPSLPHSNESSFGRRTSSRIPLYSSRKEPHLRGSDGSLPLSERSMNHNNIPPSQRALRRPSRLRTEITNSARGRRLSRTVSASTTGSIQRDTVQHKSLSLSPQKLRCPQETPEWRKRLLHDDALYGEQRDLFAPIGLENIFKPPPTQAKSPAIPVKHLPLAGETTMPSSPPLYAQEIRTQYEPFFMTDTRKTTEGPTCKEPGGVKYKLVDSGTEPFSDDLSRSSSFHVTASPQKLTQEYEPNSSSSNLEGGSRLSLLSNTKEQTGQRVPSGYSDTRHEGLSPIFISRHNTSSGGVGYTAIDLPSNQPQQHPQEPVLNEPPRYQEEVSQMLSEDLTSHTDDLARSGKFINLRRGGMSEEGSFQRKMLSPSSLPAIDESGMLQEDSIEASTPKKLPHIRKTRASNEYAVSAVKPALPPVPPATHPSSNKNEVPSSKSGSGSPLKLFGTHDTFTNQKLLRRLSEFENNLHDEEDVYGGIGVAKPGESRIGTTDHTEMNEAYIEQLSPSKTRGSQTTRMMSSLGKVRAFGDGDLDRFEFSEESLQSSKATFEEDKENISLHLQDGSPHKTFEFLLGSSPAVEAETATMLMKYDRKRTKEHIISSRRSVRRKSAGVEAFPTFPVLEQAEVPYTPRKSGGESEGKRLPRSPLKDPTPKRRRTLHKTDISHTNPDERVTESIKESHQQMQSVIGKKRKDAKHGDSGEPANPEVLATRQILRPRTHHSSHRTSQDYGRTVLSEIHITSGERAKLVQQEKIAQVQAELDSTTPRNNVGTLETSRQMSDNGRKGSVTTQDFLDEAKKIMAGIRGKTRTGLTSVEESESENDKQVSQLDQEINQDLSYEESTREPFSRPPSRDGGPLPQVPRKQQDPEVLNHLRRYEEISDMDAAIGSSLRPNDLAEDITDVNNATAHSDQNRSVNLEEPYQSDPPGIQITEYPELRRKRKHSTSSAPVGSDEQLDIELSSQKSNISSGQSTGRSIPTGSSGGSDSRRGILPHTIAYMIPEQAAGMIFDRERKLWVKRKTLSKGDGQNYPPSDDTDEDPFGDIPDLTVDETLELQRIKEVAAKQEEARISEVQRYERHQEKLFQQGENKNPAASCGITDTVNTKTPMPLELPGTTYTAPGITSQDIRLTTWEGEQVRSTRETQSPVIKEALGKAVEEIEQEISIHESRVDHPSPLRRRNVTISFSSPIASIIEPENYNSGSWSDEEENTGDDSVLVTKQRSGSRAYKTKSRSLHSSYHTGSRRLSLGGHTFLARPVSRIDEREEESFYERISNDPQQRSVSFVISTPLPPRRSNDQASPSAPSTVVQRSDSLLQLTPLSEFTIHQHDESFAFEVSYIGQQHQRGVSSPKRTLSLSVKELVQSITDIEPFEPFWEHIKQIELRNKRLKTLHMLSKFCSRLEELDVSENEISQLNGAPETTRHLRITHNSLSDLTSWNHLSNLQYVDVSNNDLTSLDSFENLIHLRTLRADCNKIRSIRGVMHLDGLLSLRLRGNLVETVDFAGSSLQRLTELDFKGNSVRDVRGLQELRSLTTLNLEDNELYEFVTENDETFWTLKYLRLSGNKLEYLDVSRCPNLRLLYLDRNRIGKVTGFLKTKRLDSLSLREQQNGSIIDLAFLKEAFEVRKLFLSGNLLTTFTPSVDFLNLQYLELANCGLEHLPTEFGQIMPNIRILNLNFNALCDIMPLLGTVRLKTLHLAGNRLSRLRRTAGVLAHFPCLRKLDLRNNPLTVGFYPPIPDKQLVLHAGVTGEQETMIGDPFTLADAEKERDVAYAGRLDMETKMRRRVFEMLMINGCERLKTLDGLKVDRASLVVKDMIWNELVKAGLVYDNVTDTIATTTTVQNDARKSREATVETMFATETKVDVVVHEVNERFQENRLETVEEDIWPAEDSFA
jgi:protein NUD1